ncbi:MAG TPA: TetR/AcrR family transcriptional regulator, partial [Solirubrobacteraceae bacterium]|nr:TetR/AcrR family transcriptional regulator [Solirubrobacteraceae bacterium]
PRSPFLPKTPTRPPPPLPPGRPRASEEEVTENHRLRIMLATARLAAEKGYSATTVTDVVKLAGLDARAFYRSFAEKQDAFMAAHELGFQELMAVTASAFAGASWPERTWEAGRAFTQFLECNPTIARAGFVEAPALGPDAAERIEDSQVAFTIFLREGYQFRPDVNPPSPVALEAIIAAIVEIVHRQARKRGGELGLSGLLPNIAHLCLTPFLGSVETNSFVDRQLAHKR